MAAAKQQYEKGISPAGVCSYPWLNKPDTKFKPEGEYKTTLRLSGAEAEKLKAKIEAVTAEQMAKVKEELNEKIKTGADGKIKAAAKAALGKLSTNYPFKDAVDDEGEPTGDYEFTFKTKASFTAKDGSTVEKKITLFDAKKNKVNVKVWGGSTIKVAFDYAPYYVPATGVVGVTLRMNAVQIINLVSGGGGGDYGFADEEGDDLASESIGDEASETEEF